MEIGEKISGTPGEVYQREMVPAIFARWAPDLIELEALEALANEVAAGAREWVDDDGFAFPQVTHIVTARR